MSVMRGKAGILHLRDHHHLALLLLHVDGGRLGVGDEVVRDHKAVAARQVVDVQIAAASPETSARRP